MAFLLCEHIVNSTTHPSQTVIHTLQLNYTPALCYTERNNYAEHNTRIQSKSFTSTRYRKAFYFRLDFHAVISDCIGTWRKNYPFSFTVLDLFDIHHQNSPNCTPSSANKLLGRLKPLNFSRYHTDLHPNTRFMNTKECSRSTQTQQYLRELSKIITEPR